jgi:predicted RNA-binding Zn-ribbon protein involved in translation (DUF1610 family)
MNATPEFFKGHPMRHQKSNLLAAFARHRSELALHCGQIMRPPPEIPVDVWCEQNIYIPAPQTQSPGYLRFDGREFLREPLQAFAMTEIRDLVLCFGSQIGKTTFLMAGVAWSIACDPCGVLWVMSTIEMGRSFSEVRWVPMVYSTPLLEAMIPLGARRHSFKKTQQQLGGAVVNFVGSNSPGNLASRPARRVILDEVDKFPEATAKEADAVNLAEQRTKSFANPQRVKVSTPTVREGLIWQEFVKGDMRRRFLPCPSCGNHVVLAWSKAYTVLPVLGCEAFIVWDKEARRDGGGWDLERVERSARAECPHCGAHILDSQKTAMDRGGEWRPTSKHPPAAGFRSYHLSSLYAASPETTFGRLAVAFLQAKNSLLGLKGFINGNLAEPYEAQDTLGDRVEIISPKPSSEAKPETATKATRLMTVDCQAKAPYFWYVVREWRAGECEGIAAGSADTWEELEEIQRKNAVEEIHVGVDSGWGARSDSEVYERCVAHVVDFQQRDEKLPLAIGWTPLKGSPGRKTWKHADGTQRPWWVTEVDPFEGKSQSGRVNMQLLHYSGDILKDVLQGLRRKQGTFRWMVRDGVATETYWRHLDGEVKKAVRNMRNGRVTYQWAPRSKHWPNHLGDCEVNQIALALALKLFVIPTQPETNEKPTNSQGSGSPV